MAVLRNFAERKNISIPLLSDPDSSVIRRFGILNESVPQNSPFFGVPHPVTFIVDENGVIRSRHFEEDYRRRLTVGSILGEPAAAGEVVHNPRALLELSASDTTVRGGERIRLFIDVKLPPKMHLYAPGVSGYVPVDWKLKDSQPLEVFPVTWPPSRVLHLKAIGERVPVFEGEFRLTRDVVISASREVERALAKKRQLTIEGSLTFQACDDKKCYVPEDVPLAWKLSWEPHDSTRVPPELRKLK